MADVYQATHVSSGHRVAIKVITAAYAQHPEFLDGFRREAQAMASLRNRRTPPRTLTGPTRSCATARAT
jgi:serine/threonine protein kinase